MSERKVVGRFAPSPSGRMHLGNVYAALVSWLSARKAGGRWLLRIEDLDRQRCRPEHAERLLDDLAWLGLEWDGDVVWQSRRGGLYEEAFGRLSSAGLLYPCFCRRADLLASSAPHSADGMPVYAGTCRSLSAAEAARRSAERPPAWRVRVSGRSSFVDGKFGAQEIDLVRDAGDFVVRRADGNFAYQLAVTVDDADGGVTEVVRGRDLIPSAHQQLFLYRALGLDPPSFSHVPLLLSADGRRLSKRDRDVDMGFLRSSLDPPALVGRLLRLCGLVPEERPVTLPEAVSLFDWRKMPPGDVPAEFLSPNTAANHIIC